MKGKWKNKCITNNKNIMSNNKGNNSQARTAQLLNKNRMIAKIPPNGVAVKPQPEINFIT